MAKKNLITNTLNSLLKKFLSVQENNNRDIGIPGKILIVRQHNQLGDLLAGVSLFRALKETYPGCNITLIVSPDNYSGMVKNEFIDRLYVFNQKKLFSPFYFLRTRKLLKENYDLAIVPVVVSISFTSNLLARLSNSKIRIGANSLNGEMNSSAYLFDRRVDLDWRKYPDSNVSERSLDIVRPFGINTDNYRSVISFNGTDTVFAEDFITENFENSKQFIIGLHTGAGKVNNRWSLVKYASLINKLNENYSASFYLTGSIKDREEIDYLTKNVNIEFVKFLNKPIPQLAAVISKSHLFISNDTGIMHVAGTTGTPQVSIFGPTNPFNWAPIGPNKFFIRKSELIDDVAVDDVYNLCSLILNNTGEQNGIKNEGKINI